MSTARKILIVDDDEDLRETLKDQLVLHDEFEVETAGTASQGIELAKSDHFDLVVFDGQSGKTLPHDGLSEGEKVLVDEALKLALAIFNARRHGAMFETLYRDEADGALDEKAAARFPSMLRRAMELGNFRNLLFVTHRGQAAEQADVTIRVGGGQAVIDG